MKNELNNFLKIAIVSGATLFAFSACQKDKADEIKLPALTFSEKSQPVMFEMTSTGCGGCGSWGKPTFANIAQEYDGKVVPLAVHVKYGDPMITDYSNAIWNNIIGSKYTPQIWVNDVRGVQLTASGSNIDVAGSITKIKSLLDEAIDDNNPKLDAVWRQDESKIYLKYGVQADALNGEYYLASYLLENGIVYEQTSYSSNPATHNHVIRNANSSFGTLVENKNSDFMQVFSIDNTAKDYDIAIVLWKKQGDHFEAVCAFQSKDAVK